MAQSSSLMFNWCSQTSHLCRCMKPESACVFPDWRGFHPCHATPAPSVHAQTRSGVRAEGHQEDTGPPFVEEMQRRQLLGSSRSPSSPVNVVDVNLSSHTKTRISSSADAIMSNVAAPRPRTAQVLCFPCVCVCVCGWPV